MNNSPPYMSIHKKMAAILAEFPAVPKDRVQPQAKYNYRGIDDALRELNPLLSKHGVYIQLLELEPNFMEAGLTRNGTSQVRCVLTGKVRFVSGEDGSFTECSLVGEGMDVGDKALMKAQANGLKYVLWYTFCVPTDEKKDSEAFEDPDTGGADQAPKRTVSRKENNSAQASERTNGDLSAKSKEILDLIAACRSSGDIEGITAQVRAYVAALRAAGNPSYKTIVDEYQAKKAQVG